MANPFATPRTIKAREMLVGDVVSRAGAGTNGAFCSAVVKMVDPVSGKARHATLFRPYATYHDFVYGYENKLVCLVGIEEFPVPMNDEEWTLHSRNDRLQEELYMPA